MMEINKADILASPEKAFSIAYDAMKKDYNKDTAMAFLETYRTKPLSFILDRSYPIIKEAYFGFDFIDKLSNNYILTPMQLRRLYEDSSQIINQAREFFAPKEQIKCYTALRESLNNKLLRMKGLEKLYNLQCRDSYKVCEYATFFFDLLYYSEVNFDKEHYKSYIAKLYEIEEPYIFFAIAPLLLAKYPEYVASTILDNTKRFYKGYDHSMIEPELTNSLKTIKSLKFLSEDDFVIDALKKCGNKNLYDLWTSIMMLDIPDVDKARRANVNSVQYTEGVDSSDALKYAMDDIDKYNFDESTDIKKYDSLNHKRIILEFMIESAMLFKENPEDEIDFYMQELCDTEAEMLALEWEDNGEPNAVIKNHIMTQKDKQKEIEAKEKEKADEKKKKIENEKVTEVSGAVKELRKNAIELAEKTISDMEGDISCHITNKGRNKFIAGEENDICLGGFGSAEKQKAVIRELKDAFDNDDNFEVSHDNYFTVYIDAKKGSEAYCEEGTRFFIIPDSYGILYEAGEVSTKGDNNTSTNDSDIPQKPKEDFSTKIQNKALDHDAKRVEKKAIKDEKHNKLKSAGKAITAGPRGWLDNIKNFGKKFDKMDENRRKEFFLKPGFRHRIFKNAKLAILYGAAAQAKLTLVPIVAVCRHFSKDKDRRVRNELVRELDTEIKICEEKINDANSNGDQQEKYKLMRIKAKLEAEKTRVAVNSKFI